MIRSVTAATVGTGIASSIARAHPELPNIIVLTGPSGEFESISARISPWTVIPVLPDTQRR